MKVKKQLVGIVLQQNRPWMYDEWDQMERFEKQYLKGTALSKKVYHLNSDYHSRFKQSYKDKKIPHITQDGHFYIDFKEDYPKCKNVSDFKAHKQMLSLMKRAQKDGVLNRFFVDSFKAIKVYAPIVNGKPDMKDTFPEKVKYTTGPKTSAKNLSFRELSIALDNLFGSLGSDVGNFDKKKGLSAPGSVTGYASLTSDSGKLYTLRLQRSKVGSKLYSYSISLFRGRIKKSSKSIMMFFVGGRTSFTKRDKLALKDALDRAGFVGGIGRNVKKLPSKSSRKSSPRSSGKTRTVTVAIPVKKGDKFTITGTIKGALRAVIIEMLENKGAKFQNHVSKDTSFIIVGSKPGATKLKKAKEYKVKQFKM